MNKIILPSVLRTGAQVLIGYLVTWAAAKGVNIPIAAQNWFVETLIVGGGIAVWTALVRWLETRTGTGPWPSLARGVARVLMLGISTQPAGYTPTPPAS